MSWDNGSQLLESHCRHRLPILPSRTRLLLPDAPPSPANPRTLTTLSVDPTCLNRSKANCDTPTTPLELSTRCATCRNDTTRAGIRLIKAVDAIATTPHLSLLLLYSPH
ncbi:hypothetical protein KC19_2G035000 [Ceratodon purpureus]|uniref:Uncharacterized protein n=1 Tax=Ceratodon purpureus TaxID=3225 RepID=A0A8T0ISJ1_CERPU|nr:hypothetical protein KC19_2G035000 [Ceratodon purpureus]